MLIKIVNVTSGLHFVTFTIFESINSIIHNIDGFVSEKEERLMRLTSETGGQLSLSDRIKIQSSIELKRSAIEVSEILNVSRQTIYREIKRNRRFVKRRSSSNKSVFCKFRNSCPYKATLRHQGFTICFQKCEHFENDVCEKLLKFPFCCNTCSKKRYCNNDKFYYEAEKSHALSSKRRSESRQGIRISKDDFTYIDNVVSGSLKKGQSLEHTLANHKEINVSVVTIRRWINAGYMNARNIDLPRAVRFKVKKQYIPRVIKNPELLIGRTYKDYKQWVKTNNIHTVQIDTVHGMKSDNQYILTIYFPDIHFQFGILIYSLSPDAVNAVFKTLLIRLGSTLYKTIFPIILCDNGFEFLKLTEIELEPSTGKQLTKVFYCDPYRSSQKGACERNHEFIRYIKAKGKTLDDLTQEDVDLMFSHINSLSRKSIMGRTPYVLAKTFLGTRFLELINIKKIDPDNVHLRPDLFTLER